MRRIEYGSDAGVGGLDQVVILGPGCQPGIHIAGDVGPDRRAPGEIAPVGRASDPEAGLV